MGIVVAALLVWPYGAFRVRIPAQTLFVSYAFAPVPLAGYFQGRIPPTTPGAPEDVSGFD